MHYPLTHPNGSIDRRYTLTLEYCGLPQKQLVLRFCGEWIDSFKATQGPQATLRAVGHRLVLNGAEIITEERQA